MVLWIGGACGMVVADAALRDQVAVVLQHVEVVVSTMRFTSFARIVDGGGNADVDGLALELFRLPIGRQIGHHPVAHCGIADVNAPGSVSSPAWVQSTQMPKRRPC